MLKDRYQIPADPLFRLEQEIKRSRFIVSLGHADSAEAAREFVGAIRDEFSDATHNCWAYTAGPPGDTARIGCSDDGEPQGTAGRPMLNVLLHSNIGECVAVVTRYFGGVKLGAGGLVRAYSGVTAAAVRRIPLKEKIIPARLRICLPYNYITLLKRLLGRVEACMEEENFGELAEFVVTLPKEQVVVLEKEVAGITAGQARLEIMEPVTAPNGRI